MIEREKAIEEMLSELEMWFDHEPSWLSSKAKALEIVGRLGYRKEEEVQKETFDKLTEAFMEMTAYGSDSNQHAGYYDYSIKVSEVIEIIAEVLGFEYNDYEEHTNKYDFKNWLKEKFGVEVEE